MVSGLNGLGVGLSQCAERTERLLTVQKMNDIARKDMPGRLNLVARHMDEHLADATVKPTPLMVPSNLGTQEARLTDTKEVKDYHSTILSSITNPQSSDLGIEYMMNVLKLHDGGEGLTCIRPNQQQEKMRSILVHGLVQKDAQDGFPILNAMKDVLKVQDPSAWELVQHLLIDMQPVRIAVPVRGCERAQLEPYVNAIKYMESSLSLTDLEIESFKNTLFSSAIPTETNLVSFHRINYLLNCFEVLDHEKQRSRLAAIRLMLTSPEERYFKLKDPTHLESMTSQALYSKKDHPIFEMVNTEQFNQDYKTINQLGNLLLTIEKSDITEGTKAFIRKKDEETARLQGIIKNLQKYKAQYTEIKKVADLANHGAAQARKLDAHMAEGSKL